MIKIRINRHFLHFSFSGIIATLTDFIIYWLLHPYFYYSIAKTVSFLAGSGVAYIMNKFLTFKKRSHSFLEMSKFFTLYSFTLIINIALNSLILAYFRNRWVDLWKYQIDYCIVIAFIGATSVSTIINFLGQKFWVFKSTHTKNYSPNRC